MTFGLYGTTLTTRIRDVGTIFGTTRPENEVSAGSVGTGTGADLHVRWWRGQDLNLRPSGYEPDELPDCSTPHQPSDHLIGCGSSLQGGTLFELLK